jgi:hypothetical protein
MGSTGSAGHAPADRVGALRFRARPVGPGAPGAGSVERVRAGDRAADGTEPGNRHGDLVGRGDAGLVAVTAAPRPGNHRQRGDRRAGSRPGADRPARTCRLGATGGVSAAGDSRGGRGHGPLRRCRMGAGSAGRPDDGTGSPWCSAVRRPWIRGGHGPAGRMVARRAGRHRHGGVRPRHRPTGECCPAPPDDAWPVTARGTARERARTAA